MQEDKKSTQSSMFETLKRRTEEAKAKQDNTVSNSKIILQKDDVDEIIRAYK